jgi:hypothetical protein
MSYVLRRSQPCGRKNTNKYECIESQWSSSPLCGNEGPKHGSSDQDIEQIYI